MRKIYAKRRDILVEAISIAVNYFLENPDEVEVIIASVFNDQQIKVTKKLAKSYLERENTQQRQGTAVIYAKRRDILVDALSIAVEYFFKHPEIKEIWICSIFNDQKLKVTRNQATNYFGMNGVQERAQYVGEVVHNFHTRQQNKKMRV